MKLDVVLACISYIYIYYTHFQMPKPYKPSNHPTVFCRPAYLQGLRTCRCRRTSPLPLRWSYPRSPAWCVHTPPGMQRSKKQIPKKTNSMIFPTKKSRFPVLQWSIDSTKNPSRFHPIPSKVSPWVDFLFKSWDHFGWLKSRISSRFSLGAFHGKWTPKPPAGYDNSTTPAGDSNDSVTKKDKWN